MWRYSFNNTEFNILEYLDVPLGIYQYLDNKVVTILLSKGFLRLFGYNNKEQAYYDMNNDMYKYTHPEDVARISDDAYNFAVNDIEYDVIYRSRTPDSQTYKVIHAIGEHRYTEDGTRLAYVWYTDESQYLNNKNYEINRILDNDKLIRISRYDNLTGLPNMYHFFEIAEIGKQSYKNYGIEPVILFINLRGMKIYNQKYGFKEGDNLIIEFSKLLSRYFGADSSCRISGDHFVVITEKLNVEDKLGELFLESKKLNNSKSLNIHVGIYCSNTETVRASIACDRAKIACDSIKNYTDSAFCYFDISMQDELEFREYIVNNLDRALENNWIQVYYQPIVRAINGNICDEEALSRWIDPIRGLLSPSKFIHILEDANLIYKLDLYVVSKVVEKIKIMEENNIFIVPQSINISRTDFDCCDMVAEVNNIVNRAGIDHSNINIEITESVIGNNFDIIKEQVNRFRKLGFSVWMDDFGSGYSSLDNLKDIRVNLIKFDMKFIQQLEENEDSKVILTELMKMANSLHMDTICEGVETESQVQFLREIGCSKLQGFYYHKPLPLDTILGNKEMSFENPLETTYYDTISKINLNDIDSVANLNYDDMHNIYNSIPMAVIELKDSKIKIVRSNRSYIKFLEEQSGKDIKDVIHKYHTDLFEVDIPFTDMVYQCSSQNNQGFIDVKTINNRTIHYLIKNIASNPLDNTKAVLAAVISVTNDDEGTSYADVARALTTDYSSLYYVNIVTEDFIKYSSSIGSAEISMSNTGKNFFETVREDAKQLIYKEDLDGFLSMFNKETILESIRTEGSFKYTYRVLRNNKAVYTSMKVMIMGISSNYIVIATTDVDKQIRKKETLDKLKYSKLIFNRLFSLEDKYICIYVVNLHNKHFTKYTPQLNELYSSKLNNNSNNFFSEALKSASQTLHKDALQRFIDSFNESNVLNTIKTNGAYEIGCRIKLDSSYVNANIKIILVNEDGCDKLIVGISKSL